MRNMGGINKRGLTIDFLDGLGVNYEYDEETDSIEVYDNIIVNKNDKIDSYSIVMGDYFLYKINVYGDVIINGLSEVEDYFLRNSYIEGNLILRDLSQHGVDFLYNTIIGGDIILDSIVKIGESSYLTNRFINGNLSMASLLEVGGDYNIFNNITVMGDINLPKLRYYNDSVLKNSVIMGKLTARALLYEKILEYDISLSYIDYKNNEHFLIANDYTYSLGCLYYDDYTHKEFFDLLNIPYREVVSEWDDEIYLKEILQPLNLSGLYKLIGIEKFLFDLKITYPLEIKLDLSEEELFKNSYINNIVKIHTSGEVYSFDNTILGEHGMIQIIDGDIVIKNFKLLYNDKVESDNVKFKYIINEEIDYIVNEEYLMIYTDDIGIINYMDILSCNIDKEECILNILYKGCNYHTQYNISSLEKLNNLYLLITYLLFPEEKIYIE